MLQSDNDLTVVLDELDRRFHPHLSRLFLQTALESGGAQSSNQLLFTTHDTNLLDLELLRRDEIWFVEKDNGGASNVYSLAEFNIRPDLKIQKGYLNGRFGAIPFVSDVDSLGWGEKGEPTLASSLP
jgi:AAA15 family ATPase/GTPase